MFKYVCLLFTVLCLSACSTDGTDTESVEFVVYESVTESQLSPRHSSLALQCPVGRE